MNANRFLEPDAASARLHDETRRVIPGGTSKANFVLKPHPFYAVSGCGCRVTDVDGAERPDANSCRGTMPTPWSACSRATARRSPPSSSIADTFSRSAEVIFALQTEQRARHGR
jgi:hypothetical protein